MGLRYRLEVKVILILPEIFPSAFWNMIKNLDNPFWQKDWGRPIKYWTKKSLLRLGRKTGTDWWKPKLELFKNCFTAFKIVTLLYVYIHAYLSFKHLSYCLKFLREKYFSPWITCQVHNLPWRCDHVLKLSFYFYKFKEECSYSLARTYIINHNQNILFLRSLSKMT